MPDSGGKITLNISEKNDVVKLEFSDSGNGIPEDVIEKIFEPLFTTKQRALVWVWQVARTLNNIRELSLLRTILLLLLWRYQNYCLKKPKLKLD